MSHTIVHRDRGICTIILNRPDVHNAFNNELIDELTGIFKLVCPPQDKVIVLTGVGKSFCAGADLGWMKQMVQYTYEENVQDSYALAKLFKTMDQVLIPIIGCINGSALGGGAGLTAVCDIVIAAESAKFGFTEVKLGLAPAVISPYVLRKIGVSSAQRYFLTGEIFDASTAREMGLVHQVVPCDDLEEARNQMVEKLLGNSPEALVATKGLIRNFTGTLSEEVIDTTVQYIARLRVSAEGQEGMNAFFEKRSPRWITDHSGGDKTG